MCDPATIAIALASAAGQSYFQNEAAGDVREAQSRAQETFTEDLRNQRNNANVQLQDSIQKTGVEATEQNYDEAVAARVKANEPSFNQRALLPGQGNASNAVRAAIVQTQDRGVETNNRANVADARLGAFGDSALRQNIGLQQNANRINTQAGFSQGALNNLQTDLGAAANAGAKNAGIADLIGAVGTIAGPTVGYGTDMGWFGNPPNTIKNPNIKGTRYSAP